MARMCRSKPNQAKATVYLHQAVAFFQSGREEFISFCGEVGIWWRLFGEISKPFLTGIRRRGVYWKY
jgi:hypothetical protein